MGAQHFEPATAQPKRPETQKAARIAGCGLAAAMFGGVGLSLSAEPAALTFVSEIAIPDMSGASAIEVDAGGARAVVLSDRGAIFDVSLSRQRGRLQDAKSTLLSRKFDSLDTEGLAIGPQGAFASFERPSVVRRIATSQLLSTHPDFPTLVANKGLEALAIDPLGRLVAFSELPPAGKDHFPVYRLEETGWAIVGTLPHSSSFLPVGADFGPDGTLYLLERSLGLLGFRARISALDLNETPLRRDVLLTTERGRHDNLEGLSVWRAQGGALCFTMVSDDNFKSIQRAEMVEYALTQTLAPGAGCD